MSTDPSSPPALSESAPAVSVDKTVAILSYVTLIGFIVALVLNSGEKKNRLGCFHLRQALGLFLVHIVGMVALVAVSLILPGFLGRIVGLGSNLFTLGMLILFVLGLIDAINGREKPVPVVGELIQQKLSGAFAS